MARCEEPEQRQRSKMRVGSVSFSASMRRMSKCGDLTKEKVSSVMKIKAVDGLSELKSLKRMSRNNESMLESDHTCSMSLASSSTSPSSDGTLYGVPPIVVNKGSVLKEKQRQENIARIKSLQKTIDSWKGDYQKAVDNAGVKARKKYKNHIDEMAGENELIRAQIDEAHRYAAVIEKDNDARNKECEQTIIALKYADEAHTKENDNIRKELSACQNELSTLEIEYSADDVLIFEREKENALVEKQRLQTRLDELESQVDRLNKQIADGTSQSSHGETSDGGMSWEEFKSQVDSLRGPLDEVRGELEICQKERDHFLEELDVLKWRIKNQHATLSLLQSQAERPKSMFKDWIRWF